MEKRGSIGVISLALFLILHAAAHTFISWTGEWDILFLIIAFVYIILSFGIIKLWNPARIATMILSLGILGWTSWSIYQISRFGPTESELMFVIYVPLLLSSLIVIYCLTCPKVKEQFNP